MQSIDGQATLRREIGDTIARRQIVRLQYAVGRREDAMHIQLVLCRGCLALTLTAALSAPATAQVDTGTISGTVKDQSGGVVPGATVTITHEGQGLKLTGVTREDGTYIFTPIRTGAYLIDVELSGFKKESRRGITVGIQEQVRLDFVLHPGGVSEDVVVTAASPLLQTGSGLRDRL